MVAPAVIGLGAAQVVGWGLAGQADGVRRYCSAHCAGLHTIPSFPTSSCFLLPPPSCIGLNRWLSSTVPGGDVQLGQGQRHSPLLGGQGRGCRVSLGKIYYMKFKV